MNSLQRSILLVAIVCGLSVLTSAQTTDRLAVWNSGQLVDSLIRQVGGSFVFDGVAGGSGTNKVVSYTLSGTHDTLSTYAFRVSTNKGSAYWQVNKHHHYVRPRFNVTPRRNSLTN